MEFYFKTMFSYQ